MSIVRGPEASADWHEDAACRSFPAILFFGHDDTEGSSERRAREERAKLICRGCAVRGKCLEYALSSEEKYGIWGGLTELERRRLGTVAR